MEKTVELSVFYDGGCPLCVREISFYRKRKGTDAVQWIDVCNATTEEVSPGLSKCDALSRLHVRDEHGALFSGASAFIKIWETLPGFRPLAAACRVPFAPIVLEKLYTSFLKIRPVMQRMAPGIS